MSFNRKLLSQMIAESKQKKTQSKPKDRIVDPMGQWKFPGQVTRIPSNRITMQGVPYPVLGVGNNGQQQMMYPGQEYSFPGSKYVDEYPMMKKGGEPTPLELAKIKAKIALESHFGNPAARRMTTPYPQSLVFKEQDGKIGRGTHYVYNQDNFVVPEIQEGSDGKLFYNQNTSPYDREAMRFNTPEDAAAFAQYYKNVAPMTRSFRKNGGENILPKAQDGSILNNIQIGLDAAQFIPGLGQAAYLASLPFTAYDVGKELYEGDYKQAGVDALGFIPGLKAFKYGLKGNKILDTSSKLAKQYKKINTTVNTSNLTNDIKKTIPSKKTQSNLSTHVGGIGAHGAPYIVGGYPSGQGGYGYRYQKRNGGDISIPNLEEGNWLDRYDEGGFVTTDTTTLPKETRYVHNPSVGGKTDYAIRRTVTPYKTEDEIRRFTQMPASGEDVDFNYWYRNAANQKDATSVPFEGDKHWNIDRGIIDVQFGKSYPNLNQSGTTVEQNRNNTLADMYKYYMLQNPNNKNKAWRQAKRFVRKEIDPRINNEYFRDVIINKAAPNTGTLTGFANENPFKRLQDFNQMFVDNPEVAYGYHPGYKPEEWTMDRMKGIAKDYLRDYKGLSKRETRRQIRDWENEYNKPNTDVDTGGIYKKPECPEGYEFNYEVQDCFPKKQMGGQLQQFAPGGFATTSETTFPLLTREEHEALYNSQIALNKFYENEVRQGRLKRTSTKTFNQPSISNREYNKLKEGNLSFYKHPPGAFYDALYKKIYNLSPSQIRDLERKSLEQIQKSNSNNQLYYRDMVTPAQNLVSPFALVDRRVKPQRIIRYEPVSGNLSGYPGGNVEVFDYDPLYIKPPHLRSKKENLEWEKLYGDKPENKVIPPTVSSLPPQLKMVRNRIGMEPLSVGTPSINRQPSIQPNQSGDYVLRFSELNSEGQNQPRELFFKTRKEADDMMDFLQKQNENRYSTGTYYSNLTTQGNYRKGGQFQKFQSGGPWVSLPETEPTRPIAIEERGDLNLLSTDYLKSFLPEYKRLMGVPNAPNDMYDRMYGYLKKKGMDPYQSAHIGNFLSSNYDQFGDLKRYIPPPVLDRFSKEEKDRMEEEGIKRNKKVAGKFGEDYLKKGGQLQQFLSKGFATTDETTKYPALQSDIDLLNQSRQELLDWYTARVNHPDPRISGEAKQVLENFSKLPADVSQGVDYKGINYLVSTGVLGRYEPYHNRVELSNPYLSVEEQLNKPGFGYIRKDPKLKEHYEKVYTLSRTGEPIKHEGKHRDLEETADPIVNKYSDQIYSQFVSPEEYREHLYERLGKPDLSRKAAGKWGEANFDRDAYYGYRWITGTGFPNFKVNRKGHVKNMVNAELNRALMELRTEYGIDPTKNTTPDDFKNIYEKAKKSYEDAIQNKDPEKRLRYEHFLDLFNIHGNDFEKLNNLNNLLVGVEGSSLPIANKGFNVKNTGQTNWLENYN